METNSLKNIKYISQIIYKNAIIRSDKFRGTKHPFLAFCNEQRKTRSRRQQQTLTHECRTIGDEIKGNVVFSDSAE